MNRGSVTRRIILGGMMAVIATGARADDKSPLEGTWGGPTDDGGTAKVVVTGDDVTGFDWGGDHLSPTNIHFATNGTVVFFDFKDGSAQLLLTGAQVTLFVHDDDGMTTVHLKKN